MKTTLLSASFFISFILNSSAQSASWMNYDMSNSPLPSNSIGAFVQADGGIWVGTDQGLAFFNDETWTIYTSENSALPDDRIRDLHHDIWGTTWAATDNGILRIDEEGWTVFNMDNSGLPSNVVRSVSTDSEGNLWVGTWGGGLASFIGDQWTVYNTLNSDLPSNGVFTVELDHLGRPWVGTFNGGVSRFDGSNWTTFNTSNSDLPHDHVRTIILNDEGAWLGTDDGLAHIAINEVWDIFTYQNIGFGFHTVYEGIQDQNGIVYFGSDGGLLAFEDDEFNVLTAENSNLASNNIRCVHQDDNGNLWIGTGNDGISVYSPQGQQGLKQPLKGADIITVYPNPTPGGITILLPNRSPGNAEVVIMNGIGEEVLRQHVEVGNMQHQNLNLSTLNSGTYVITVVSEDQLSVGRFVKL